MGKYLTVGQVSKMLDCSPYYVTSLIEDGKLESHRFANRGWHRISRDSVRDFMAKHGLNEGESAEETVKLS